MSKSIQVSASILSADFTRLGDDVRKAEDAGVDLIHIDVMDGHFVPNISIGHPIVKAVRGVTSLPIEAHLMIENPWRYLDEFMDLGADVLMIHAECYGTRRASCREYGQFPKEVDSVDADRLVKDLQRIRKRGKQAYVVLNPGTPFCLQDLMAEMDGVLIMSVNPGYSGQAFIPEVLRKARQIREDSQVDLAIDGGVNAKTAPAAVDAGINILATASYFYGSSDPRAAVDYLKKLKSAANGTV